MSVSIQEEKISENIKDVELIVPDEIDYYKISIKDAVIDSVMVIDFKR